MSVYMSVCVRESVGFCWTWRNTPLHSHKGTLSPAGQRHLSRTKETKYDVGVCSLLELWYRGGKKGVCQSFTDIRLRKSKLSWEYTFKAKELSRVDISNACTFIYLWQAATTLPATYKFSIFGAPLSLALPFSLTNIMCFPHTDFTCLSDIWTAA